MTHRSSGGSLRASAATLDITPTRSMDLGAGVRRDAVVADEKPREPLEASFLVIWERPNAEPLLFITLDLLYVGAHIRDVVEAAAHPLSSERIVVGASHTHQAPMVDNSKPLLGQPDPEYTSWLASQIGLTVQMVLDFGRARPVRLRSGSTVAQHSVNRRRFRRLRISRRGIAWNSVALAPNPRGHVDETISAIDLVDEAGSRVAVMWNYGCHPVAHPERERFSSHFIHHAREALRRHSRDASLPVLFFQGFSGDTRPRDTIQATGWREGFARILRGPSFGAFSLESYGRWATSLASCLVNLELAEIPHTDVRVDVSRVLMDGGLFVLGMNRAIPFHAVSLAPGVALVGAGAEVVSEYAPFVRELMGAEVTMCLGCLDDVFGYIPTASMIEEGGYEGGQYCSMFGLSKLLPSIETATKNGFRGAVRGLQAFPK